MNQPLTRFVRDRIRERNFDDERDREYIRDLLHIEELIVGPRPTGMFEGWSRKRTDR